MTQGYGPEMYTQVEAPEGVYRASVHYFASDRSRASTRTKVFVTVYRGWGTPAETVRKRVLLLEEGKQSLEVATIEVER